MWQLEEINLFILTTKQIHAKLLLENSLAKSVTLQARQQIKTVETSVYIIH